MTSKPSSDKLRLVFDSNIYIAASSPVSFISRFVFSPKREINPYELFVSPAILEEVQRKLEGRIGLPRALAARYIAAISEEAQVVHPGVVISAVLEDPDDNIILECSVQAKAHLIISADKHLLKLSSYEGIAIIHPRELKRMFPDCT